METLNVSKDGWVNRLASSSGNLSNSIVPLLNSFNQLESSPPPNWRLTRAILKNGTLTLYKAPSDLQIKAFDSSLVDSDTDKLSVAGNYTNANTNTPRHQRTLSTTSLDKIAALAPPITIGYRGFDSHPDLEYDESAQIIGAGDEALCHSILFGADEEFAKQAILVLPLMTDIVNALLLLKDYLSSSVQLLRASPGSLTPDFVVSRAKLIIDTITTSFSGMVLENRIHAALQQFADAMSSFDDATATNLKMNIFQRHEQIHHLVTYNKDDEASFGWNVQNNTHDYKSDKVRQFLAQVDTNLDSSADSKTDIYQLFSPEIFAEMTESDLLAHQVAYFHLKFYQSWSPATDISLLFKQQTHYYHRYNPLVFDFGDMHFLGRLIVQHLFRSNLDATGRARTLSHWISLGNALKGYGDIVGWLAIASVICSVPVLRLRDTWSYVPKDLRDCVVKDWGFEIFEVEKRSKIDVLGKKTFRVSTEEMGETYPKERAVPYFGDLFVRNLEDSNSNSGSDVAESGEAAPDLSSTSKYTKSSAFRLSLDRINRINTVLNGWKYYFDQVPHNDTFGPRPQPVSALQKMLYSMLKWNVVHSALTPEDILQLSLIVEPTVAGTYLKSHYSQRSPLATGGFLPLIFTDTNPSYELFAKPALIAASGFLSQNPKKSSKGRTPGDSLTSTPTNSTFGTAPTGSQSTTTGGPPSLYEGNNQFSSSIGFSRLRRNPFGANNKSNSAGGTPSSVPSNSTLGNNSTSSLHTILPSSNSIGPGTVASISKQNPTTLHRSNSFPPGNGSNHFALTTGIKDVDVSSRQFVSRYESHNIFMKSIRDVLNVGTTLFNVKDDIVLKAFDDDITSQPTNNSPGSTNSSRPSSVIETPSKRMSENSARRVSAQLVNISQKGADMNAIAAAFERTQNGRNSSQSIPSINVVVKAANLERLVDILVLGVNEFSSFIPMKDLENLNFGGNPTSIHSLLKRPPFRIDMNIHTLTFFATFRSFCAPADLLNSLKRRFIGAGSAALSIVELDRKQQMKDEAMSKNVYQSHAAVDDENLIGDDSVLSNSENPEEETYYPNWEPMSLIDPDNSIAWRIVAQIQIGVLEACHLWVSQYFGDFMNDFKLRQDFLDLIRLFGTEIYHWKEISFTGKDPQGTPANINEDYKNYLESMETLYKKVRNLFVKKSYRPNDIPPIIPGSPIGTKSETLLVGNNDNTTLKLEKWLDEIDIIANELHGMVQLRDWLEVFEILELQGTEQAGFFNYRAPLFGNEEDIVIQDIFSYFDSLQNERGERVLLSMPRPVQELFRLHNNIVNYIVSQICDPMVYKDDRVARMSTVLKMLGICRARMGYLKLFSDRPEEDRSNTDGISTRVPALIESALVSAILRPESRLFANSWIQAGRDLSQIYDSHSIPTANQYEHYVPKFEAKDLRYEPSKRSMAPCVGWVIERMLEIVCYVPNMSVEHTSLINFDKRRYVYNLITNIAELNPGQSSYDIAGDLNGSEEEINNARPVNSRRDAILVKMAYIFNPDKHLHMLDRRLIREGAVREAKQYPRNLAKSKVFIHYVQQEVEKAKRDNRQRELLEKQGKDTKRGMHKFKSTMSSAGSTFNGIMGGSGEAGQQLGAPASSSASFTERKQGRSRFGGFLKAVRPISMAFTGSLTEKAISPSNERIVSTSQLPDINTLNDVRCKMLMNIELFKIKEIGLIGEGQHAVVITVDQNTYGLQALNEEDAQEWVNHLNMSKRYAVYKMLVSPTCTKVFGVPLEIVCERENKRIPNVVETLLGEIERRGMEELGLYRVSGSVASVNLLKQQFDTGAQINKDDSRWFDINTVAGCFKLYLRELPEPILTNQLSPEFIECGKQQITGESDLGPLYEAMRKLPEPNFSLLKRLLLHLGAVAALEAKNKMKTPNLAIVFSMSFLPSNGMEFMRATQNLVNAMIVYHEVLLRDEPPVSPTPVEVPEPGQYSKRRDAQLIMSPNDNGNELSMEEEETEAEEKEEGSYRERDEEDRGQDIFHPDNLVELQESTGHQAENHIERHTDNEQYFEHQLVDPVGEAAKSWDTIPSAPVAVAPVIPDTILEQEYTTQRIDKEDDLHGETTSAGFVKIPVVAATATTAEAASSTSDEKPAAVESKTPVEVPPPSSKDNRDSFTEVSAY